MAPSTDQKQMMGENDKDDGGNQLETDALLTMGPAVAETVLDMPEDNENLPNITCRFCGEGNQGEDEDEDDTVAPDGYAVHKPMDTRYCTKNNNRLIRPCKCKGSMLYVHIDCLNQWRTMSPRQESFFACDLCGYQYNLRRPFYATIITHSYFLHTMTILSVLSLILTMAYLAKALHVFVFNQQPMPEDPDWAEWHGITIMWIDRVYLAVGVLFVSALGILHTFYLSLIDRTSSETPPGSLPWLMCCDQPGCSWYGCYLVDIAACNGNAAWGGLIILAGFLVMMTIAVGIAGATFGVFAAVESVVKRIAGQVKERILEVTL